MQTSRVAMWLAIGLALGPMVLGQVYAAAPAQATVAARSKLPDDSPILDWSNVWEAHHRAEKWAGAGDVGSDWGTPIAVKGLIGVRVTLRWSGILLGEGQVNGAQLQTGSNGVVDLALCTRDAMRIALKQAQEHLVDAGNRFVVNQKFKPRAGGDFALTLKNVGPLMTVDLQAAHSIEAIHLEQNAPAAAIYWSYVPMFHGLRLVHFGARNEVDEAWLWPGQAVSENLDPSNQLLVMVSRLGLSIEDAPKIGRPGGIDAQRFEVIQVVRPANELVGISAPPANLVRGNVVLPPTSLDSPAVERLSDRLTAHLIRQANSDGSFAGVYMPTRNEYEPAFANDEDTGLILYALARRAGYLESLDPTSQGAKSIRDVLRPGMAYMAKRFHDQGPAFSAAGASLMLLSLVDSSAFADQKPLRDEVVGYLGTLRNPDGFYRNPATAAAPGSGRANFSTQSLILDALAHTYSNTRDPILGDAIRKSLVAIWPMIQPENTIGSLPWLSDAQFVMERYEGELPLFGKVPTVASTNPATQPGPVDPYPGLKKVLKLLSERQISRPPTVGPADVVGGFEFGQHAVDAAPMADWRSAMALHFVALALKNPKLVGPDERIQWILCVGAGTRFINQLMFEEPSTYYVRAPDQALGGVRLSLIDNKIAPSATATSLLATTQFQETLRFLAK